MGVAPSGASIGSIATAGSAGLVAGALSMAAGVLGRWNWWLPDWAARLLRVPTGPRALTPRVPVVPRAAG